jgi:hypothetical protein
MLHLLGIDHRQFTLNHLGLDAKLTGVEEEAQVLKAIIT